MSTVINVNRLSSAEDELEIVLLAAASSKAAYGPSSFNLQLIKDPLPTLDSVEEVTSAARDGSIKACIIASNTSSTNYTIIVAFRGTASLVDWLVNLDGDEEDATSFVNNTQSNEAKIPAVADTLITAHAGLLRVANAMAPTVCKKIMSQVEASLNPTELPILLLTGHSAGGGVAGLIAAHIRACRADILSRFRVVHCVTFAAPPVLSSPMISEPSSLSLGISLNIVNFGDIVPRATKTYIRSLLALYTERAEDVIDLEWDFGEPDLWNYGLNVLLIDVVGIGHNLSSDADLSHDNESTNDAKPRIRAFQVSNDVWRWMACGSVKTHPMDVYLKALEGFRDTFDPDESR
jgi:Lipase (class 3)